MGSFLFNKNAGASVINESNTVTEKTDLIVAHLKKFDLIPDNMTASFEGEKLVVEGEVNSIQEKNKILATAGNIQGVSEIVDRISITGQEAGSNWGGEATSTPEAETTAEPVAIEENKQFYTVKKGDYLSAIAKRVYGNANKYPVIFEANRPMLKDASLIYPGQVLVIPALDEE